MAQTPSRRGDSGSTFGRGAALGSSPGFRFRLRSLFLLIMRCVLQMAFLEQPHVRVAAAREALLGRTNGACVLLERVCVETGLVVHVLRFKPCRLSDQFLTDGVAGMAGA